MQNYHRHTSYSNIYTADSAAVNEDYAKRAVELGHKVISSVEHGWQGYYFETYELARKYGLKFVFGAEAYWVKNRTQSDRTNSHIILLSRNENGRQSINNILSEANITGYYYKPRVDLELLLSLPPKDVFVTTACIAFWNYEDIENIVVKLHDHFGENFMLEIQYHNTKSQIELNKRIKYLSKKYGIELIVGLDSHYIYEKDAQERDYVLAAKNIHYEDEEGWFMDYPDDETVMKRFLQQGIFTQEQIQKAMDNTDICLSFEDYDNVSVFSKDIKLPTLYMDLTKEEKDKKYSRLITQKFKEYMKNVPPERYNEYFEGVKKEVETYKDTGMVDYPLIDYAIVQDAVKHGGLITDTGRGSAVGYFTNTLCGFSKVDRFTSAIKLYPERFISKTRILETHSLPDIDLNVGTPEIFEQAQINVLGEDHVAPMIAFGTFKKKSAFKLYARAKGLDFEIANEISEQIGKYEDAVKYADDDEKDEIDLYDYVEKKYLSYIEASEKYWGIISDKKKAPSAYLLYQGNIRKEIGLIKCKSKSTKKEYITCVIDGAIAEDYKYLKNDILKVDVVLLIDKIFKRIGIEHFDVNKLLKLVEHDSKVWNLYANGYTIGLNQCEKESTTKKCMKYKPSNISELSAFIASIRPGFKSMYSKFESREPFNYGIPAFDKIIQTEQFPYSFIMYQEQTMNTLNYAGFPLDECYGIIKAIAKKHPEKVRPLKSKFIEGFKTRIIEDEQLDNDKAQEMSEKVWQIISDSCGYGFNCVSGNTKIKKSGRNGGFEPTVEEMYRIMNDKIYAKETHHYDLHKKYQANGYGYALSMFDDNIIRQNKIVSIAQAGVRLTYKIVTETGKSIICTDNHKFPTPKGKKRLDELKIGDLLYCMGNYEVNNDDHSLSYEDYEKNYPQKGECGFRNMPEGAFVIYQSYINAKKQQKCPCERCGKEYSVIENFELHHKDHNRKNNTPENFEWLCNSCHKKIHYENGRNKRYEKGIPTYLDRIVSITPEKTEMTYDIEMADPAHTFVSENGLVVSNSAHAFCMALDSLYNAWQKANYPYEFYEIMLQHYSDKGNKDKVALIKQEMLKAYDIKEGKFKFGADNRRFKADKENGVIYSSLLGIKGLSQKCADDLYKLSQKTQFENFYDLYKSLKKVKSVNSAKINVLVKIGYFDDFAKIGKIQKFIDIATDLYGRLQFSKSDIKAEYLPYIMKYSEETEKQYRNFDFDHALYDIWSDLENKDIPLYCKLQNELELLGYIQTTVENISPQYAFIKEYECKFKNPKLTLYRLCNGDIEVVKVKRSKYDESPIHQGDIIKTIECSNEGRWYKDENDEWQQDRNDKETILKKWSFVR